MNLRNYAFIDAQNLYVGVKKMGWKLEYKRFRIFLQQKFSVEKAFLFIGYIPSQSKLYQSLAMDGYKLVYKPTIQIAKGTVAKMKGNVDAELVLHAMIEYSHYDQAVIVSCDGDFYCLADYLLSQYKLSRIIVPNPNYSTLLKRFSHYIFPIELVRKKVEVR